MAGRGPAPKPDARRRNKAARGAWKPTEGVGWQHGPMPDPPDGLMQSSVDAWQAWMTAWFAAHWTPADLPGLRQLVKLHDQLERGEFQRATEFRLLGDTYGVTPKGQQDRHWSPPEVVDPPAATGTDGAPSRYGHLSKVK